MTITRTELAFFAFILLFATLMSAPGLLRAAYPVECTLPAHAVETMGGIQ